MDSLNVKQISNELLFTEVEKILASGQTAKIPVKGTSMHPFITSKDTVLLKKIPFLELEKGDIALARTNYGIVLHRVIAVNQETQQATLQGDGNLYQTEIATAQEIIGVAIELYKQNKNVTQLRTPRVRRIWQVWQYLLPGRRYLLYIYRRIKKTK